MYIIQIIMIMGKQSTIFFNFVRYSDLYHVVFFFIIYIKQIKYNILYMKYTECLFRLYLIINEYYLKTKKAI